MSAAIYRWEDDELKKKSPTEKKKPKKRCSVELGHSKALYFNF